MKTTMSDNSPLSTIPKSSLQPLPEISHDVLIRILPTNYRPEEMGPQPRRRAMRVEDIYNASSIVPEVHPDFCYKGLPEKDEYFIFAFLVYSLLAEYPNSHRKISIYHPNKPLPAVSKTKKLLVPMNAPLSTILPSATHTIPESALNRYKNH